MFSRNSSRSPRRFLVVEFNPHQILVAEYSRPERGVVRLDTAAEFEREDIVGLRTWIESTETRGWTSVIVGIVTVRGVVQRETVEPARLLEPGYLETLVQEQQKGRFLTATPFKIIKDEAWTFRTVSAVDGMRLPATGPTQPALICALANDEVLDAQQKLPDRRLVRERVEPGLLSLFGALYQNLARRDDLRAVVVILILERVTAVYILGKEGVHTPNPVLHGLNSVVELGRKEMGNPDEAETLAQLHGSSPPLIANATKLVGRISRDLKPVIDSFEMTTGQPVDEIFCAYLPAGLSWIGDSLARATGRELFPLDVKEWLPSARLQAAETCPPFGPHWLGALGLIANLPEAPGRKIKRAANGSNAYHRPWHVDSSVITADDNRELAGRRFLASAAASSLALLAMAVTAWQIYATYTLRADTQFWEHQMSANQRVFKELTASGITLKKQSDLLDHAYDLMAEPFQFSDLLVNLGRTIPPHVRVERIESADYRVSITGSVLEQADEASTTLSRYIETLRRNPAVGPLFANMAITTLQRKTNNDEMTFELTLRLNRPAP